jgi:hypothetical protein
MNNNVSIDLKLNTTDFDSIKKVNNKFSSSVLDPIHIKINQKASTNSLFLEPKKTINDNKNIRTDIYGEIIKKGGKQKISFADNPIFINNYESNEKKDNLIDIVDVESYKDYNKLMAFTDYKDEKYIYMNEAICCESCFIF